MKPGSEKYQKIINLLKESRPGLGSTEDIEKEVIRRISKVNYSRSCFSEAVDFLFSWVYIGWVRRALISASVILVLIFVLQQGVILKRIDMLSRQTILNNEEKTSTRVDEIDKLLTEYKNYGRRFPSKTITISEKQMQELLESVNELKLKYKDLESIIDSDPELQKMIQKKLNEYNRLKINL
jgi:hypothetical protein